MDYYQEKQQDQGFQPQVIRQEQSWELVHIDLPKIPKSSKLKKVIYTRFTRIVLTQDNRLFRWLTQQQQAYIELEFPERRQQNIGAALLNMGVIPTRAKDKTLVVKGIYPDQLGIHTFITGQGGVTFYMHDKDPKLRHVNKLQGISVKSLFFLSQTQDRCQIIIGSDNGIIIRTGIDASLVKDDQSNSFLAVNPLIKLNTKSSVQSLIVVKAIDSKNKNICILFALANNILFVLQGQGKQLQQFIFKYANNEVPVRTQQLPKGPISYLKYSRSRTSGDINSFIYTNGRKLYLFEIIPGFYQQRLGQVALKNKKQMRYVRKYDNQAFTTDIGQLFVGLTQSDFHYFLLFSGGLAVINKINYKLQKYQQIKGNAVDLSFDTVQRTLIAHTARQGLKIDLEGQQSDIWPLLIQKQCYRQAYNVSVYLKKYVDISATYYADQLFQKRNYPKAAQLYAKSVRSLQQTMLKFMAVQNRQGIDSLIVYIKIWLKKLKPQQKTQKCLLLSVIAQLIIYQIIYLDALIKDDIVKGRLASANKHWEWLLANHLDDLNQNVIYQITQTHGRINQCLKFAQKKGNYKLIVQHHLNMQQYKEAVKYLAQFKDKAVVDVIYKYAYLLIPKQPQQTVQLLTNQIIQFKGQKLIYGLLNLKQSNFEQGIKLLSYCLKSGNKQKIVGNILLYLYSKSQLASQKNLLQLLRQGVFDNQFALRVFEKTDYIEAQVIILGQLQMQYQAVTLALQNNKLEIAKNYANHSVNDQIRKKLWLKVAAYMLNQNHGNVKQAIQLTKKQDSPLRIQDLLPLFNENIRIQHFKDQICNALKKYSQDIDQLKRHMHSYSQNAQQLKSQLKAIRNRSIQLDSSHRCEQCNKSIFGQQFYIFPCLHGFHKSCLLTAYIQQPRAQQAQIKTLNELDQDIQKLKRKLKSKKRSPQAENGFFNALGLGGFFGKKEEEVQAPIKTQQQNQLKQKMNVFDSKLAKQCIYCGPGIVASILAPFQDQQQRKSWQI